MAARLMHPFSGEWHQTVVALNSCYLTKRIKRKPRMTVLNSGTL